MDSRYFSSPAANASSDNDRSRFLRIPRSISARRSEAAVIHAKSATLVDESAWYLSIVAVDPAVQGQGLGRILLEPTIAEADRAGVTCYLETFSQRNLPFYQRLGFETAALFTEPTTGADYAVMVRRPVK